MLSSVVLVAISGCSQGLPSFAYRVTVPTLKAKPLEIVCHLGDHESACLVVLREDWERVVRELKAACLALGGAPETCLTSSDARE